MRSALSLVAVLAAGFVAFATPIERPAAPCLAEHCSEDLQNVIFKSDSIRAPITRPRGLSNAERLQRGMTLNPPVRRGTSTGVRRQAPSSFPALRRRGHLQLIRSDTDEPLGFISKRSLNRGQLQFESDPADAVVFNFRADDTSTVQRRLRGSSTIFRRLRITIENSNLTDPNILLGLVQGRDDATPDIGIGSFNYLYFAGVSPPGTAPRAKPTVIPNAFTDVTHIKRAVETDIWIVNLSTGLITAQWINTNGSKPKTKFFSQHGRLYAGGDFAAFSSKYGHKVVPFKFKIIEI